MHDAGVLLLLLLRPTTAATDHPKCQSDPGQGGYSAQAGPLTSELRIGNGQVAHWQAVPSPLSGPTSRLQVLGDLSPGRRQNDQKHVPHTFLCDVPSIWRRSPCLGSSTRTRLGDIRPSLWRTKAPALTAWLGPPTHQRRTDKHIWFGFDPMKPAAALGRCGGVAYTRASGHAGSNRPRGDESSLTVIQSRLEGAQAPDTGWVTHKEATMPLSSVSALRVRTRPHGTRWRVHAMHQIPDGPKGPIHPTHQQRSNGTTACASVQDTAAGGQVQGIGAHLAVAALCKGFGAPPIAPPASVHHTQDAHKCLQAAVQARQNAIACRFPLPQASSIACTQSIRCLRGLPTRFLTPSCAMS